MTHLIRKNAPKGATHFEIYKGQIWYFRLNDDDTVDVDTGAGWERPWWIDIYYLQSRQVHPLASTAATYWYAVVIALVLLWTVLVRYYG